MRLKGATEEESVALLEELYAWLYQKRYLYQHPWQVGDLLIIDNYGTLDSRTAIGDQKIAGVGQCQHRATDDYIQLQNQKYSAFFFSLL